jgi:shikimate O-hydroxycinnamoyltransferase
VTILSRDRVFAETPRTLRVRCALTDVFVRDVQVSVVFFYDYRLDTVALRRGLARVLGDFAPFNARLDRRGLEYFIECGKAGASFSTARSDDSLPATLAGLDERARLELVDRFDAHRAWSTGTPVLAVRVTHFADGQSALGVTWHHTVGDLNSVMAFMKAWSRAVTGLHYDEPLIVEDRDDYLNRTLFAPAQIAPNLRYLPLRELPKLAAYMLTKGRDKRRVTLHFEQDELERMRATLQGASGQRLSINDAISAHVCSVVSERDIEARDRRLSIAVDYRRRADLPDSLIGNMVSTVEAVYGHGEPAHALAADLRSGVDNFAERFLNHHANLRYVQSHGGVAKIGRFIPTAIDPFSGSLLVSNWSGSGIYDIDFGQAAPSHFLAAGSGPLPWLGVMHEGFRSRGLMVELELPRAVVARMLDEAGQREVHRYRVAGAQPSDAEFSPAWLA